MALCVVALGIKKGGREILGGFIREMFAKCRVKRMEGGGFCVTVPGSRDRDLASALDVLGDSPGLSDLDRCSYLRTGTSIYRVYVTH